MVLLLVLLLDLLDLLVLLLDLLVLLLDLLVLLDNLLIRFKRDLLSERRTILYNKLDIKQRGDKEGNYGYLGSTDSSSLYEMGGDTIIQ